MKYKTLGWTLKTLASLFVVLVAAVAASSSVHQEPGDCDNSYSYLICEDGCDPRVVFGPFRCCNTIDSTYCCQRNCVNVDCIDDPDDPGTPYCDPTDRTTYSLGDVFTGPCYSQTTGLCAGTPAGWIGPTQD